jgi:hypothetical protein
MCYVRVYSIPAGERTYALPPCQTLIQWDYEVNLPDQFHHDLISRSRMRGVPRTRPLHAYVMPCLGMQSILRSISLITNCVVMQRETRSRLLKTQHSCHPERKANCLTTWRCFWGFFLLNKIEGRLVTGGHVTALG